MNNIRTKIEVETSENESGYRISHVMRVRWAFAGWLVPFFLFIFFVRGQSFNHSFSLLLITKNLGLKNYLKTKIHIFKKEANVNNFILLCRNFIVTLSYN